MTKYRAATTLSGWDLLYLPLGTLWPPALLAGVVAAAIEHQPTRVR
jgi:hypothetical protein